MFIFRISFPFIILINPWVDDHPRYSCKSNAALARSLSFLVIDLSFSFNVCMHCLQSFTCPYWILIFVSPFLSLNLMFLISLVFKFSFDLKPYYILGPQMHTNRRYFFGTETPFHYCTLVVNDLQYDCHMSCRRPLSLLACEKIMFWLYYLYYNVLITTKPI